MRKLIIVLALVVASFAVQRPAAAQMQLACEGISSTSRVFSRDYSGAGVWEGKSAFVFVAVRRNGDVALFGFFTGGGVFFLTGRLVVTVFNECIVGGSVVNQLTMQSINIVFRFQRFETDVISISTPFDPNLSFSATVFRVRNFPDLS